eukprot:scaffold2910_cov390-Prasinococcus_capsulatus_cf.AAC.48
MNDQMGTSFLRYQVLAHRLDDKAMGIGAKKLGSMGLTSIRGKEDHRKTTQHLAEAHQRLADMFHERMGRPLD